ncbi:discoidin domain-containing protein [Streptomyces violens]|uniref:discoidin domain-containing protein n=1 Tax=Streptomyces violens TaxID=66377 RepID=UPI00056827A5|nr:discoidin domain-containing protein [Streptomyces violens]
MSYSPRPQPRAGRRMLVPLLAGALIAAVPPVSSAATPDGGRATGPATGATPAADGSCATDGADWKSTSTRIDPEDSHHPYVGNGYLGQRVPPNGTGYAAPGEKTGWPLYAPRYDGAFAAGLYAEGPKSVKKRQAIAALPTWSTLNVATGGPGAETFSSATKPGRISHYRQSLLLRCGLVRTSLTWTAADGRATDLVFDVLADRTQAHTGAVRLRMTPHWSGPATVTDTLDGRGARRISQTGGGARSGDRTQDVTFRTDGTRTAGAVASTLRTGPGIRSESEQKAKAPEKLTAHQGVSFPVHKGRTYEVSKYVGVDTALTSDDPRAAATRASQQAAAQGWDRLYHSHATAWQNLWRSDIEVRGREQRDLQAWVRSAQYGLLANSREGSSDSIAPAGLTSDNYAGEIFWDAETWMYPGLLAAHPELARSIVEYRYKTRAGARANAKKLGYDGLFFPWTSGGKGDLWKECHSWDPPHCKTQNHLMGDVSLAAWQYYLATKDTGWLRERGWPLMQGIAQFWASRVTKNGDGSYSVKNVAGPDEYSNGVDDGVFTNAGAATALRHATRAAAVLGKQAPASWNTIADKLRIPYDKKQQVFQQYDGYKGTTIKQADTVLLQYPLQWPMSDAAQQKTLDYYAAHTDPDGPAMTDSVHAIDAAEIGEPGCAMYTYLQRSVRPFMRGPFHLFSEARGEKAGAHDPLAGSPTQDFLTGKGGFLQVFTHGLTGLRLGEDRITLDPTLPPQLADGVTLRGLHWQGRTYDVALGAHHTEVRLTGGEPMTVATPEGERIVSQGAPLTLKTRRPDQEPTANVARCRTAKATSEEPGMYAGAALDGNTTTAWVPDAATGTLTADLGSVRRIGAVTPRWTDTKPESYRIQVSRDGRHWTGTGYDGKSPARYVRVTVRGKADAKTHPGIAELRVAEAEANGKADAKE